MVGMVRIFLFSAAFTAIAFADLKPLVLYRFQEDDGNRIADTSGVEPAADLEIPDQKALHRAPGALTVLRPTLLATRTVPTKLVNAVKKSGEITLSAWITPANLTQSGPARIVTLSRDSSNRNVTLGQDQAAFDIRFRTDRTGPNGLPSLSSGPLQKQATHVVFTRSKNGAGALFINGQLVKSQSFPGLPRNWDPGYRLALGNELSGDRPWLGTYHQVAIYDRALSAADVTSLFQRGLEATEPRPLSPAERSRRLFINHIEPLIAQHCLECHDAVTAKGDLDLSTQKTAFLDPEILAAGHPEKSLLWESVASDEMPEKRPSLSQKEKTRLREWIETGAVWVGGNIDPSAHRLSSNPQTYPRRLTTREYIATVKAATGVDIAAEAKKLLPPELRADGFKNTAYNLGVDLKHIEAHAHLANLVVEKLDVSAFARRFSSNRKTIQTAIRPHLQEMGTWLLRGPLSNREIDLYHGIVTTVGAGGGDFDTSISYVLRAMLQSPRFLYRIESEGTPDAWELASRLSYLVWGGPPDAALFEAVRKNSLHDPAELRKQVERLLRDPRAVDQSLAFISGWLNLDHLDNLEPDRKHFPGWEPQLAADMRRETLAFAKHLLWEEKRPLGDLLNARFSFLTPALARHYGLDPQNEPFAKYDLSQTPRGGLLTQGSLLTIGGDEASMVTRGLFVLNDLLRGSVKDPPAGVDTTPVPSSPGLSQRKVAEKRMQDKACAGCHAKFEPLAFGLEQYDGLARFSLKDSFGNSLREDGRILIPGSGKPVTYENSRELMDLLAASPRVRETIIWKIAQFGLGRPIATSDRPHLEAILSRTDSKPTYQNVLLELATSPLITQ